MVQLTQPQRCLGVMLTFGALLGLAGCGATSGWVMNNSGLGYYQQGQYALARHEFAQAVAAAPWNPDYRHNLAMTLKQMGDVTNAERILRHNLTINVMHQPTYHLLAQLLNEQGRQGEALDLVQTWAETQPYLAAAHIELAWLQREMGNLPDAERELRHALQVEPQNPYALAHLGSLYHEMGQPHHAAQLYQRSLAVNWNQPQVQARLASLGPVYGNPMYASPMSPGRTGFGPMMPYAPNLSQPAFGPAAGVQLAAMQQLPPPLFDQSSPSTTPVSAMASTFPAMMQGQTIPPSLIASGTPSPSGVSLPGMPMTPQPLRGNLTSSIPSETIVIPASGVLDVGPVLPATPETTQAAPSTTAGSPITAAKPLPSGGWQPITQAGGIQSTQGDPAHVAQPTPLPPTTNAY